MKQRQQTDCMAALIALAGAEDAALAGSPGAAEHLVGVAKLKLLNVLSVEFGEQPERILMTVGAELARLRRRQHPDAVLDHAISVATAAGPTPGSPLQ